MAHGAAYASHGKKGNPADSAGFSRRRLEQARQVLRYSQELAEPSAG